MATDPENQAEFERFVFQARDAYHLDPVEVEDVLTAGEEIGRLLEPFAVRMLMRHGEKGMVVANVALAAYLKSHQLVMRENGVNL